MTTDDSAPKIVTGSVFDPPEAPYFRYLIARRWPAGVPRGAVDQWDRELAPSDALLTAWQAGEVDDQAFEARYEAELEQRPAMIGWAARTAAVNGIVLVDDAVAEPAPRTVLASILARRIAADQSRG
ncbi:MAG: DUF488 family protein [Chloroflexi bacterium]|nr:DUF488 family protein [Chloroflexota bacterium]MDA1148210.1 DUF488 family protein [Chloroflexota bacterium]